MTFQQALDKKQTVLNPYSKNGFTLKVFVAPKLDSDLHRYRQDILRYFNKLGDSDAIRFSSNGQFILIGLNYDDGVNLLFDILPH